MLGLPDFKITKPGHHIIQFFLHKLHLFHLHLLIIS